MSDENMKWQFHAKNNKVFVYKNGEMTPVMIFERKSSKSPYIYNGRSFKNVDRIADWVDALSYKPDNGQKNAPTHE